MLVAPLNLDPFQAAARHWHRMYQLLNKKIGVAGLVLLLASGISTDWYRYQKESVDHACNYYNTTTVFKTDTGTRL
jgi:hypothetical protein